MDEMNVQQPAATTQPEGNGTPAEGKTFTQEDVNRIIGERLAKEKEKGNSSLEQREKELAMREFRMTARELLESQRLPLKLVDALNYTDQKALENSIAMIRDVVNEAVEAERSRPVKFSGLRPAEGTGEIPAILERDRLREIMLNTKEG